MSGSAQQLTYSLELAAPTQPGHVSDSSPKRVRPYRNDNASPVAFGVGVSRSTNADLRGFDVVVAAKQFLGVTAWGQSQEAGFPVGTANDGIASGEQNAILQEGEILVSVSEAVTPESPVRVTLTTGVFCTTADSSTHTTCLVPNAMFITSTAGAGVAKLVLNLPGNTAAGKLTAD